MIQRYQYRAPTEISPCTVAMHAPLRLEAAAFSHLWPSAPGAGFSKRARCFLHQRRRIVQPGVPTRVGSTASPQLWRDRASPRRATSFDIHPRAATRTRGGRRRAASGSVSPGQHRRLRGELRSSDGFRRGGCEKRWHCLHRARAGPNYAGSRPANDKQNPHDASSSSQTMQEDARDRGW